MLAACRLAGLSALRQHYARVRVGAQFGLTQRSRAAFRRLSAMRVAGGSDLAVPRPACGPPSCIR